jgi:hypothetical protein
MELAALIAWVLTALGGFYPLATWLRKGGLSQQPRSTHLPPRSAVRTLSPRRHAVPIDPFKMVLSVDACTTRSSPGCVSARSPVWLLTRSPASLPGRPAR